MYATDLYRIMFIRLQAEYKSGKNSYIGCSLMEVVNQMHEPDAVNEVAL
jgi:hypothetical protein